MSATQITVERINDVRPHTNADRLDVVQVLGYSVVVRKGTFKVGDAGVYFPPDILIPEDVAQDLGVVDYLKHAVYPGDEAKSRCRVGACRLRGEASYGFLMPCEGSSYGADVTAYYGGKKYFPPVRILGGDCLTPVEAFHEYTEIQNLQRHPDVFDEQDVVRITEKIHGSSARLSLIDGELMAGSHHTRRKDGLYWGPMQIVEPLLRHLGSDVIIFGEIFGQGIQDMDYGAPEPQFRAFDICQDGVYLDWARVQDLCFRFNVPLVPVLATGHFNSELVAHLTDGASTFKDIRCKFKGREGCVITPVVEQYSAALGGRKILKSVSVDYHDRRK